MWSHLRDTGSLETSMMMIPGRTSTGSYEEVADLYDSDTKEEFIIKEEIKIEEKEESEVKPDFKSKLEIIPIVYTTRLDEMLIFKKDMLSLSVFDIIENVILESKPKFTEPLNQSTDCMPTFDGAPFFQLVEKLRQFNELCSPKDKEEDDILLKLLPAKSTVSEVVKPCQEKVSKLMKLCKPCTIPLVPNALVSSINGVPHTIYDIQSKRIQTFVKGICFKVDVDCVIAFRNLEKKSTEIYGFNEGGMYVKKSKRILCCSSQFHRNKNYGLNVDVCCWFYKKYALDCLIYLIECPSSLQKASKHPCPPDQCRCCCRSTHEDNSFDKGGIPVNSAKASAESLGFQLVRTLNGNSLSNFVDKALTYTKNDTQVCDSNENITVDLTKENERLGVKILKNYTDTVEFYELKSNGNIVKHIEMGSKYFNLCDNFEKTIKLNVDSDKVFCCWYQRDAMVQSFEFKHIPTVTQFIRIPHPCPPENCICCCKPSSVKPAVKLDESSNWKYDPKHAFNYSSIVKKRRKFYAKPKITIESVPDKVTSISQAKINEKSFDQIQKLNNYEISPVRTLRPDFFNEPFTDLETYLTTNLIHKNVDTVASKKVKQTGNGKIRSRASKKNVTQIKQATEAAKKICIEAGHLQSQTKTRSPTPPLPVIQEVRSLASPQPKKPKLKPTTVVHVAPTTPAAPAQNNITVPQNITASIGNPIGHNISLANDPQGSTVNNLVSSILQRFHDVRLIISPDGDVSAELNMPMQNLSTPELQLLSKILTHAKQQVKELKAAGHLSSGTNTVLNPWPTNVENTNHTTQTVGGNAVLGASNSALITSNNTAPVVVPNVGAIPVPNTSLKQPICKESVANTVKSRLDAFQCYTNLSALKMKEYLKSCKSYLSKSYFKPKSSEMANNTKTSTAPPQILTNKSKLQSENSANNGVKRKRNLNPNINEKATLAKKSKLVDSIDLVDDIVSEEPMATLTPITQSDAGIVPILAPVGELGAPILSGLLTTPAVIPDIASNETYVPLPLVQPAVMPSEIVDLKNGSPSNDDDFILGF